jgi:hypothetical protein
MLWYVAPISRLLVLEYHDRDGQRRRGEAVAVAYGDDPAAETRYLVVRDSGDARPEWVDQEHVTHSVVRLKLPPDQDD